MACDHVEFYSFPLLFLSTVLPSHHIACHIVCMLLPPLILVRCTHTQILFVSSFYLSTHATIWLTNSNSEQLPFITMFVELSANRPNNNVFLHVQHSTTFLFALTTPGVLAPSQLRLLTI